jgi:hypothetical protein
LGIDSLLVNEGGQTKETKAPIHGSPGGSMLGVYEMGLALICLNRRYGQQEERLELSSWLYAWSLTNKLVSLEKRIGEATYTDESFLVGGFNLLWALKLGE